MSLKQGSNQQFESTEVSIIIISSDSASMEIKVLSMLCSASCHWASKLICAFSSSSATHCKTEWHRCSSCCNSNISFSSTFSTRAGKLSALHLDCEDVSLSAVNIFFIGVAAQLNVACNRLPMFSSCPCKTVSVDDIMFSPCSWAFELKGELFKV